MKTRTSLVLAVVAAGLAVFIYFFERHQASTDELRDRGDRVLPGFDRDRVDTIVLGEGDERVELERVKSDQPDATPPGAVGEWKVIHPRELDADPGAVDKLLSAVDWLERRRTVDLEKTGKSLAALGLAEPRRVVSIKLRGRDVTLKLGGKAPGKGLYLSVSTHDEVYVVEEEFLEQISKEVGDLRDKRLGQIRVSEVDAVRITGRFHAQQQSDERWELQAPIKMRANTRGIEDVVRDLERLRAERFIADDVTEERLSEYGLDRPSREVTVSIEDTPSLTLRFGDACEGHSDEVYATALGSGTVACVGQEILDELDIDPQTLRDMRPTSLDADQLEQLEITRGGEQLTLRRRDERWTMVTGDDADDDGVAADEENVAAFIEALEGVSADDVVADLAGTGLEGEDPRADVRIRLVRTDDRGEDILYFAVEPTRVLLRRGDEAIALALPASFEASLSVDALDFRDRLLLDEDDRNAEELEVTLSGPLTPTRQLLKRRETRWDLTTPLEFRADDVAVRDIVRSVSTLRTERFVAASPIAEHGLSRPRIQLRIRFAGSDDDTEADGGTEPSDGSSEAGSDDRASGPREHVLLIGNEAEDGWYARLDGDDQTVFLIQPSLVEQLDSPLIDRDLFAVEEELVQGLIIERGGEDRVEVERGDNGWTSGETRAPEGAVDAIIARLEVVRASEVLGFGQPGAETGLRSPRARLFLRLSAADEERTEERVIIIGSAYGDDDTRRVYVRREDVDVTFGVPERAVRPILEYGMGGGEGPDGDEAGPSAEVGSDAGSL